MDQTAEQMITLGENPVNDQEALQQVEQSDINAFMISGDMELDVMTANRSCSIMMTQLYDLVLSIATDDSIPADVQDVFMDHARWYRIEGKYKLGRAIREHSPENPPAPAGDD